MLPIRNRCLQRCQVVYNLNQRLNLNTAPNNQYFFCLAVFPNVERMNRKYYRLLPLLKTPPHKAEIKYPYIACRKNAGIFQCVSLYNHSLEKESIATHPKQFLAKLSSCLCNLPIDRAEQQLTQKGPIFLYVERSNSRHKLAPVSD